MRAGDDDDTCVKLNQTVGNFVYLYYSNEYYANNKDVPRREVSKKNDLSDKIIVNVSSSS
jgi:hypothetical protein